MTSYIKMIEIDRLKPHRLHFRLEWFLTPLIQSIGSKGISDPVKVKPDGWHYTILDGHRRYLAARALGLTHVPCQVILDLTHDRELRMMMR